MSESVQNIGPAGYDVEITVYTLNGPQTHQLFLTDLRIYHDGDEFILRGKPIPTCRKNEQDVTGGNDDQ